MTKYMTRRLAILLAVICLIQANVYGATTYNETITPNSLTLEWVDGSKEPIKLDTFRIRGYNVAQLRTLVEACGGSVIEISDKSYQIVKSNTANINFSPISFTGITDVRVQYNSTSIRNSSGVLVSPSQPGWVLLVDYGYNWGSLRDILDSLELEITTYTDDPDQAKTTVRISPKSGTVSISPTVTPTPASTLYDLESKEPSKVLSEIEDYLSDAYSSLNSAGRYTIYGRTKKEVTFKHDYLTWVGSAGDPIQKFNTNSIIPENTYVEYTYIGSVATPTPNATKYDLGAKSVVTVAGEIKTYLDGVATKTDSSGRPVVYGTTKNNTVFTHDYRVWIGSNGSPLTQFDTGKVVPKGDYVEYTYIGNEKATPTPVSPVIYMNLNKHDQKNIVEVPQIENINNSDIVRDINSRIVKFADGYNHSKFNGDTDYIEIKAYPLKNSQYVSIVMTRAEFPESYEGDTEIVSFVYDYINDKEYTLANALDDDDIDDDYLEPNLNSVVSDSLDNVKVVAFFAYSGTDNVYFYRLEYDVSPVEYGIAMRRHGGKYAIYNNEELPIQTYYADMMIKNSSSPLFWETNS